MTERIEEVNAIDLLDPKVSMIVVGRNLWMTVSIETGAIMGTTMTSVKENAGAYQAPAVLSGAWGGQSLETGPKVCNQIMFHVIELSFHPMLVQNSQGVDCFRTAVPI